METQPAVGNITIAPEVLEVVVRLTALAVPGVTRLITPPGVQRFLRQDGVKIKVAGDSVQAEVHIVTEPGANMLKVGHQIQTEVTRAIREMVGMKVTSIDVHIEDVGRPT